MQIVSSSESASNVSLLSLVALDPIAISAGSLNAQVSVISFPPAALMESSAGTTFTAQVVSALPGEDSTVIWSLNDLPMASTIGVKFRPGLGPVGLPPILKATSAPDPTKFAAVPVIPMNRSDLTQLIAGVGQSNTVTVVVAP
jgi:hypothetical protein